MTRDDIIRMAVKCQLINAGNRDGLYMDALAEFAELVSAAEREWVGLTDEEIDKWNIVGHESLREFVRAIEAKLKEKNG